MFRACTKVEVNRRYRGRIGRKRRVEGGRRGGGASAGGGREAGGWVCVFRDRKRGSARLTGHSEANRATLAAGTDEETART